MENPLPQMIDEAARSIALQSNASMPVQLRLIEFTLWIGAFNALGACAQRPALQAEMYEQAQQECQSLFREIARLTEGRAVDTFFTRHGQ